MHNQSNFAEWETNPYEYQRNKFAAPTSGQQMLANPEQFDDMTMGEYKLSKAYEALDVINQTQGVKGAKGVRGTF